MILERLTTKNFKGLPNRPFEFCEGITLVVGPNRAGKSSLHQALLTALFGPRKGVAGLPSGWKEALPWGFTGEGLLSLGYRTSSGRYLLERTTGRAGAKLTRERDGQWQGISTGVEEVSRAIAEHIGIDSPSIFTRTVSVAQGDLARLESADCREVGRALEEVLVGRTGATFEHALRYLERILHDDKIGLRRKTARDRLPRKLDRLEEEAADLQGQMKHAKGREDELERLRKDLAQLQQTLPESKRRLRELAGDPERGEPPGFLTRLRKKRQLEQEEGKLDKETRQLNRLVGDVNDLDKEIKKVQQQITAQDAWQRHSPDQIEEKLRPLEDGVVEAKRNLATCEERMKEAETGLGEVEEWFRRHPGFRDSPQAAEDAADAFQAVSNFKESLRFAREELENFGKAGPRVFLPAWRLILGSALLITPLVAAWITGAWAAAAPSLIGAILLGSYARRLFQARRSLGQFNQDMRVKEGTIASLEGEREKRYQQLKESLALLGISENEAEEVFKEHGQQRQKEGSLREKMPEWVKEKKEAERRREEAEGNLRRFCQQFGVETPGELRNQVGLIRKRGEAEGKRSALLGDRSLEEIQRELGGKSVELRAIREQLKLPEYAYFAPTAEEIQAWEREATSLDQGVRALETREVAADTRLGTLLEQSKEAPTSHELEQRLEWHREEISRGNRTASACNEAIRLLKEVQGQHRTTYLPTLEEATATHLKRMTGGFYSAVNLASEWPDITVAEPNNPAVPPEDMSGGSRDQLYFAFRLAVADQLSGGKPLPFLLDDPFANFDQEHRERALDILTDLGLSGRQVIYFTMLPEIHDSLERRAAGRFPVRTVCPGG